MGGRKEGGREGGGMERGRCIVRFKTNTIEVA